jgi:hypothetical protein
MCRNLPRLEFPIVFARSLDVQPVRQMEKSVICARRSEEKSADLHSRDNLFQISCFRM